MQAKQKWVMVEQTMQKKQNKREDVLSDLHHIVSQELHMLPFAKSSRQMCLDWRGSRTLVLTLGPLMHLQELEGHRMFVQT